MRGYDSLLRGNAEADLEFWDGSTTKAEGAAVQVMESLAKLAGYRIDWHHEPVKLVRL